MRGSYLHAFIPTLPSKYEIHFFGKCSKTIAEKMKEIASESENKLHFTGVDYFVRREEIDNGYLMKNWLAGMAIFPPTAHYKRKELTKFFEYMTAGLPIICSNFPTWLSFINKYQCGITVDPNKPEEWENAINYLRNNPRERNKMIENGRKAVKKELNWQAEEKKLLNWYEELQ